MTTRIPARYTVFFVGVLLLVVLHEILLHVMAEAHVAHVLLASGRGGSSAVAALLAALFVVVRVVVVVVVPPVVLFVSARVAFHALRRGTGERRAASVPGNEALAQGEACD